MKLNIGIKTRINETNKKTRQAKLYYAVKTTPKRFTFQTPMVTIVYLPKFSIAFKLSYDAFHISLHIQRDMAIDF